MGRLGKRKKERNWITKLFILHLGKVIDVRRGLSRVRNWEAEIGRRVERIMVEIGDTELDVS